MAKNKKSPASKRAKQKKPSALASLEELGSIKPSAAAPVTRPRKKAINKRAVTPKSKPAKSTKKLPQVVHEPAVPSTSNIVVVSQSTTQRLKVFLAQPTVAKLFAVVSVAILLLTTLFWTVLSARLHQSNADQLIDADLFESGAVFQGASFPGAHSFLVKWPIFAMMRFYGHTEDVYLGATVLMVLLTVGALAYLLYRIERRLVVFGILCLALSSVLLLIPTQPYPGALLPVNMAMTTTRNLEYVLYILGLLFAVRLTRFRSRAFASSVLLLGLVIASDKLFIALAVGSGIVAAVWYGAVLRNRFVSGLMVRWLMVAIAGIIVSAIILLVLGKAGVTHILNETSTSPYPLVHSVKQFATGLMYGVAAILTNFGANPVHSVLVLRDFPRAVVASLPHPSIAAYGVNLIILGLGLYATGRTLLARNSDNWTRLSVLLIGSTVAASLVFVLTDHYYPVDARYLTIGLFAVFIAAAAHLRGVAARPRYAFVSAVVLLLALPTGLMTAWHEYNLDVAALSGRDQVTARVSDELHRRKIGRLVGDYWDVTPVKAASSQAVTIMPVDHCTMPRAVLNSSAWFSGSAKNPSAYLAIRDGSPSAGPAASHSKAGHGASATYGGCSLARVVGSYGVPSERVAIGPTRGPESTPDVLLLLYPDGIKSTLPGLDKQPVVNTPANPVPVAEPGPPEIQSLVPFTDKDICSRGMTMQTVAHEDDDLLFMNPDVDRSIKDGRCIRTVYLTAGDAGESKTYWGGREQGAKAAYAEMYGVANNWQEDHQILAGHTVTVDYLVDIPQVSLIFLRLPDGNLRGEGFRAHDNQSLPRLLNGSTPQISAVDGSATYTQPELVAALLEIMVKDLPDQIRTQGSSNPFDGDHHDHYAVGVLTDQAAASYLQPHEVVHYMGYPDKELPRNLSDDDITIKQATFLTYAKFDGAVCQTAFECQNTYTYGSYLTRQYVP